jgi:hypothetical protein
LSLDQDRWLVVDHLGGRQVHHYALHWLLDDAPFEQGEDYLLLSVDSIRWRVQFGLAEGKPVFSVVRGAKDSIRGWRSRYYGQKEPAISAMLEADRVQACFWTFFGFEEDLVLIEGNTLKLSSPRWTASIDLRSPGL